MSPTKQLNDPDALLASGKSLLDQMPVTPAQTQQLLRSPPRGKDAAQTARLSRWFAWISRHVGNGQIVAHCIDESSLRAAWRKSESDV